MASKTVVEPPSGTDSAAIRQMLNIQAEQLYDVVALLETVQARCVDFEERLPQRADQDRAHSTYRVVTMAVAKVTAAIDQLEAA